MCLYDTILAQKKPNTEAYWPIPALLKHASSGHFGKYLTLAPSFSLSTAPGGNVFIPTSEFVNDTVHIQASAVVHLHSDTSVWNARLQLTDFLQETYNRASLYFFKKNF